MSKGGPHLEGLVGTENRCDLVPAVRASHSAELADQPLACLAVVGHLFLVVWAHQALGTERAMTQSANSVCKGADLHRPDGGAGEPRWWCSWWCSTTRWCMRASQSPSAPSRHPGGSSFHLPQEARGVMTIITMTIRVLALWLTINLSILFTAVSQCPEQH